MKRTGFSYRSSCHSSRADRRSRSNRVETCHQKEPIGCIVREHRVTQALPRSLLASFAVLSMDAAIARQDARTISAASSAISSQAYRNSRRLHSPIRADQHDRQRRDGRRGAQRAFLQVGAACLPHARRLEPGAAVAEPHRSRTAFVSARDCQRRFHTFGVSPANMRDARSVFQPAPIRRLKNSTACAIADARQGGFGVVCPGCGQPTSVSPAPGGPRAGFLRYALQALQSRRP